MGRRDISFASFNLLNLQLPGQSIYGDTDGWDDEIYHRKIDYTARVFKRLGADVIGLQELWAGAALNAALDMAGLSDTIIRVTRSSAPVLCEPIFWLMNLNGLLISPPNVF